MFFVVLSINFDSFFTDKDETCYAVPCQTNDLGNHHFINYASIAKVFIWSLLFLSFWVNTVVLRIDLDLGWEIAFMLKYNAFYLTRIFATNTSFPSSVIYRWSLHQSFVILLGISFYNFSHRRFIQSELFCYFTWWHMGSRLIFLRTDHPFH